MAKGINSDSSLTISVALLIKAAVLITIVIGSWYQAQMRFANMDRSLSDMHEELVVLTSKVHEIEKEHIQDLETAKVQLEEENRSLMQRLGLKK